MSRTPYNPVGWKLGSTGGTPMNVTNLGDMDSQIEALDNDLAAAEDNIASLLSATLAAGGNGYTTGTTFPAPTVGGPLFLYQTDHKLYTPQGTGWFDAMGNAAPATTSGTSNAPQSFSALVNSDNTVSTAWTLPAPPTGYTITAVTVREKFASPNGVSGMPLAGTATSNTRPASSVTSTREYFVTCTFTPSGGGTAVESAESNHVTVYLPYGASATGTGGGTTGTTTSGSVTPASILGIGTNVFFSVDIGNAGGANVSHTMAELVKGYVQAGYFSVNATSDAVAMQCYANSGTTSGSPHPRTELREVKSDGTTKAAWSAAAGKTHVMSGTSTITHLPADSDASGSPKPWVCFAQIHDAAGDVVRLQVEGSTASSLKLVSHTHSPNGTGSTEVKTTIQSSYTIGTAINWKVEVTGTTCNLYLGGVKVFSFTISGSGFYYKVGDYQQFTTAVTNSSGSPDGGYTASSYATVELKNLAVTHSPAL